MSNDVRPSCRHPSDTRTPDRLQLTVFAVGLCHHGLVTQERRAFRRHTNPMDGRWRGASGESECRIADLSWGGCFVETVAEPAIGEETVITVPTPSGPVQLAAKVCSVERGIGFSVQFNPLSQREVDALYLTLGEPTPARTRPINDWLG